MLSQPTKSTIIRVEEKRFKVVPVVFDSGSSPNKTQKALKDRKQISKNQEEAGEWINVYDDIPAEVEGCKIDKAELLKGLGGKISTKEQGSEKKTNYTHFLSVPLNLNELQEELKKIHAEIYKTCGDKFKGILIPVERVHLTMIMLKLDTQEKKDKVNQLKGQIQREITKIIDSQRVSLGFGNFKFFKKGEQNHESRVIYASLKENEGLKLIKEIIDCVTSIFIEAEVLDVNELAHMKFNNWTKKYELEEPHVTILKNSGNEISQKEVEQCLSALKKLSLSEVNIDHFDISVRGQFEEDGHYKTLHRFYLNQ